MAADMGTTVRRSPGVMRCRLPVASHGGPRMMGALHEHGSETMVHQDVEIIFFDIFLFRLN